MIVNPRGAIVSVNRAFEAITGYTRADVIGKSCTILDCDICEKVLKPNGKPWCALFETGIIKKTQCIIKRKDGTSIHAVKNASILNDISGNIIGAVETVTDDRCSGQRTAFTVSSVYPLPCAGCTT